MRKLASIQKIISIDPHPNADTLEIAKVLGWHVIIKKGEFKSGDEIVYIEVDSVLPKKPEFEFLSKYNYRVKTIKLRGVISQGIVFPKSIIGKDIMNNYHEGDDVTDLLNIIKYEPPISANLTGEVLGKFPSFIPKTDEDRITSNPELFYVYKDNPGYITEKVDGSSVTYYMHEGKFGMCSRNLELKYDLVNKNNIIYKYAVENNIEERLKNFCTKNKIDIAIQGEMLGEKIQGNKYKLKGNKFLVFSVYNITAHKYFPFIEMIKLLDDLKMDLVPLIPNPKEKFKSIDEMIEFVKTLKSKLNSEIPVEGIVWRSLQEGFTYLTTTNRLSFKVINPEFLLKFGE